MSKIIENNFKGLKNSPIYNLSICSLENFHTCFLKWLGQNYPQDFLRFLLNKNYPDNLNINFETQVRHSKDVILDLQILINDGKNTEYIIIENKLKSYPTSEQLLKYQNCFKGKKAIFILLSLASNFEVPNDWKYISYQSLAENLSKISNFKNKYDEYLIKDYTNVIATLSNVFPKTSLQKYDFYKPNKLDEIGIKDIFIKYLTSEFVNYIEQKLNQKDLYIGCSFHNKKGTIDIVKYSPYKTDFDIGIQIEGNQYRYFINAFCDYKQEQGNSFRGELAQKLLEKGLWFKNTIEPKKTRIYKSFCGYNSGFVYRYFQMNEYFGVKNVEDVSYKQIVEQINKDVLALDENLIAILKTVQDIRLRETNIMLEDANMEPIEF